MVAVNAGRFVCHFTIGELRAAFAQSFSSARKYRWALDSIAEALSSGRVTNGWLDGMREHLADVDRVKDVVRGVTESEKRSGVARECDLNEVAVIRSLWDSFIVYEEGCNGHTIVFRTWVGRDHDVSWDFKLTKTETQWVEFLHRLWSGCVS